MKWHTELIDHATWWTKKDPHQPAPRQADQRAEFAIFEADTTPGAICEPVSRTRTVG
jgi:hypothetical protein